MRPLERLSGSSCESPGDDIRQRLRDLPQELQPPYDWTEFRRRERRRAWPSRNAVKWEHAAVAAGITVLVASMAMWGRANHQQVGIDPSGMGTAPLSASGGVTPRGSMPGARLSGHHIEGFASSAANGSAANGSSDEADTDARVVSRTHDGASRAHDGVRSAGGNGPYDDINEQFNAAARARAAEASLAAQAAVASQLAALARTPASKRWLEQQPAEPAVVRVGPRLAVANLEDRIAWVDDALTDAQFGKVSVAGLQALQQERARLMGSLAQVRYAESLAAQVP